MTRAEKIKRDGESLCDLHILKTDSFAEGDSFYDRFVIMQGDKKKDTLTVPRKIEEFDDSDAGQLEHKYRVLLSWLDFEPEEKDCLTCPRRGVDCDEFYVRRDKKIQDLKEDILKSYLNDDVKDKLLNVLFGRDEETGEKAGGEAVWQ